MTTIPTVFGIAQSTCTSRIILTALQSGGIEGKTWKFEVVDHASIKQEPWLTKRQPFGKIPAYEDPDVSFYESRAISRYLAEKLGGSTNLLLPQSLKEKAIFEQWASLENNTFSPQLDTILIHRVFYKFFPGFVVSEDAVADAMKKLETAWKVLEKQLSQTEAFIVGDHVTLVDFFFTPNIELLQHTPEGKTIFATYPNIKAWWSRIEQTPGYKGLLETRKQYPN